MDRIKIVVWGINDIIWSIVKNTLDPEKVEVVLFIDSNEEKQGVHYENIPIIAPSRQLLDKKDIDVYLITALSAYENIRKQLMLWGREAKKIQPFITDEICKYSLGTLDEIDRDFIKEAYFEPSKKEALVNGYREIYPMYAQSRCLENVDWVNKGTLISHGCGGIVNGRKIMCSNSKETFDYTIRSKFKLMECDVLCMKNGELVLGHDFYRFYEAREENYTMMTLEELIRELNEHREISCLVDVKWDTYDDYTFVVKEIDRMLSRIAKDEKDRERLRSGIVMEVYDEKTIQIADESNFQMFFTQYRNPEGMNYLHIVNLCCQYGMAAIGTGVDIDERLIKICRSKGIKIFVYSTDSIEEYSRLRKMGAAGVFTNYLRPMECE